VLYTCRGVDECARTRIENRGDQSEIEAARLAITQSALAIKVSASEYYIQVLHPVFNPVMAKIGAQKFINAPLGIAGHLDASNMPIDAYVYMGDAGYNVPLLMPWDGIIPSWGTPWNRRRERRRRERAASLARDYASFFKSEFIKARSKAHPDE
jgi:hypothetical protein